MKFKEYADHINKLLKERPETAEFEVLSSADDEGNYFNSVHFAPSVGFSFDGEFVTKAYWEDESEIPEDYEENAICIN